MNLFDPRFVSQSLANAGVGVWAWDFARPDSLFVQAPCPEDHTGSIEQDLSSQLLSEDWQNFRHLLERCLRNAGSIAFDVRYRDSAAEVHRLRFRGGQAYLQTVEGEILSGVFWEVSERTSANVGRTPASSAYQPGRSAQEDLIAKLGHELRTPLTAILGQADMLRERLNEKSLIDGISEIHGNSVFLLQVIEEMLDLSCL